MALKLLEEERQERVRATERTEYGRVGPVTLPALLALERGLLVLATPTGVRCRLGEPVVVRVGPLERRCCVLGEGLAMAASDPPLLLLSATEDVVEVTGTLWRDEVDMASLERAWRWPAGAVATRQVG